MSFLLDSNVLIAQERAGASARQALTIVVSRYPGQDLCISIITLTELAHGAVQADSPARRSTRFQFIQKVMATLTVYTVTAAIALKAGRLHEENTAKGLHIGLADLLIGVTALELGFGVLTRNVTHF